MNQLLVSVTVTAGFAVLLAALQTLLRYRSRRIVSGVPRIRPEDHLFWAEWVVAASVAITVFIVRQLAGDEDVTLEQFLVCVGTIFFGYVIMPALVKRLAYQPNGDVRHLAYVYSANFVALLFVIAVVGVGVKVFV